MTKVNHGEAFVARYGLAFWGGAIGFGLIIAGLIILSACVHVRHYFAPDFPQKDYERCVASHGGQEPYYNQRLGLWETCKTQVWREQ